MTYDTAGNLTNDTYTGAGNRTYDAENKITSAWGGINQAQLYGYDGSGQRIKRTVNGTETWQVYGFGGELLAEYPAGAAATSPQNEYGYRNGELLVTASLPGSDHSLNLNGTSAFVQGPSSSGLSIAGAITVEAWIKIDSIGAYRTIISKEAFQQTGTGGGYRLAITDLGRVRLDLFQSHNTYTTAIGTTTVTPGVWQHVAGVFDGSQMRIYLNGVLNGTVSTTAGPATGTGNVYLGRFSYSLNPYYFNGLIDEARVSNAALYTSNFTPANSLTASGSTKGLWKFNGQTTNDSSGNSNNGTLQGGAGYSGSVPGGGGSVLQLQWLVSDHLGTPRMIFDQSGSLANMKRHDYLPFGEELIAPIGGRSTAQGYSGDGIRQQFTQKERDNETGLDYFLARYYSSIQGRFTSPDEPFADQFAENPQSWNLYSYVRSNPLVMVDPTGRLGDYYSSNGEWLFTDNIRDDKVYVVTEVNEPDGSINYIPQDLGITHTEFTRSANIVRHEGATSDANEYIWIAHTSNNEASAIRSTLYNLLQSGFSSVPRAVKRTGLATTDSSVEANAARAGVIGALTGAADPTGGARRWDGTDFLAWGLNSPNGTPHNKFEEFTTIDIPRATYNSYLGAQRAAYGNSVTYGGTRYNLPAAVFTKNANWVNNNFHYVTGARNATVGITATGTAGRSIFWRF